jgi:hypothetical protein
MLSPSELAHYGGGGLTRPFVENLFAECQVSHAQMHARTHAGSAHARVRIDCSDLTG